MLKLIQAFSWKHYTILIKITTCTPNTMNCGGSGGCKGSIPQLGYSYVQLFGLTTEKEYPYWSGVTGMTGKKKQLIRGYWDDR